MVLNDKTALKELDEILATATKITEVDLEIKLVLPNEEIKIDEVIDMDIISDYGNKVTDDIRISFLIPEGDYVKIIYPERENLEIELIKIVNSRRLVFRYRAIIMNNADNKEVGRLDRADKKELDQQAMSIITCQCVLPEFILLNKLSVNGIYRDTTPKNMILNVLNSVFKDIKINGKPYQPIINFTPENNKRVYNHILAPTGSNVFDLITDIQNLDYGVYNGDIGVYLTTFRMMNDFEKLKSMFFIYPLFNASNYESSKKKLNLFVMPGGLSDVVDNSYKDNGDIISLVISDDIVFKNSTDMTQIDNGTGIRSVNPATITSRTHDPKSENLKIDKDLFSTDNAIKNRKDGININTFKGITDNEYALRSKLMRESGKVSVVKWTMSDPEVLFPGMPIRITYLKENNVVGIKYGVLQAVASKYRAKSKNYESSLYIFIK